MLGLAAHLSVPAEPQPGQIVTDRLGEFIAAALAIDILEPQQKPPAGAARRPPPFQRGADVSQMQIPGRAWGEPRHLRGAVIAIAAADDSGPVFRLCLSACAGLLKDRTDDVQTRPDRPGRPPPVASPAVW